MANNQSGNLANLFNFKHISEISEADQEKALGLAEKIKKLWETHGMLSPETADPYLAMAERMVGELQQIGFLVSLEHKLLFEKGVHKLETSVDLRTLKNRPTLLIQ